VARASSVAIQSLVETELSKQQSMLTAMHHRLERIERAVNKHNADAGIDTRTAILIGILFLLHALLLNYWLQKRTA
jgi:hypothetical protein